MDRITPEQRSHTMSRIRSKNTRPEMVVRRYLYASGFRYRLHSCKLPGHPDIILPKYKTAIEVRGCFWHRHPGCKIANTPSSNIDFWQTKFKRNVERDKRHANEIKSLGWSLIVIWECETVKKKFPPASLIHFVETHKPKNGD